MSGIQNTEVQAGRYGKHLWQFALCSLLFSYSAFASAHEAQNVSVPSDCIVLSSGRIGKDGGSLLANDAVLLGVHAQVSFPPDALKDVTDVALGYCKKQVVIRAGQGSGIVLSLMYSGLDPLKKPAVISIDYPQKQPTGAVIPYRVDLDSQLHVMQILKMDNSLQHLEFLTLGPGMFTWVFN